jgi:hypothetical protein
VQQAVLPSPAITLRPKSFWLSDSFLWGQLSLGRRLDVVFTVRNSTHESGRVGV